MIFSRFNCLDVLTFSVDLVTFISALDFLLVSDLEKDCPECG